MVFFFFKQKTAYEMRISDWSSDVCSSDLDCEEDIAAAHLPGIGGDHAEDDGRHQAEALDNQREQQHRRDDGQAGAAVQLSYRPAMSDDHPIELEKHARGVEGQRVSRGAETTGEATGRERRYTAWRTRGGSG